LNGYHPLFISPFLVKIIFFTYAVVTLDVFPIFFD